MLHCCVRSILESHVCDRSRVQSCCVWPPGNQPGVEHTTPWFANHSDPHAFDLHPLVNGNQRCFMLVGQLRVIVNTNRRQRALGRVQHALAGQLSATRERVVESVVLRLERESNAVLRQLECLHSVRVYVLE